MKRSVLLYHESVGAVERMRRIRTLGLLPMFESPERGACCSWSSMLLATPNTRAVGYRWPRGQASGWNTKGHSFVRRRRGDGRNEVSYVERAKDRAERVNWMG